MQIRFTFILLFALSSLTVGQVTPTLFVPANNSTCLAPGELLTWSPDTTKYPVGAVVSYHIQIFSTQAMVVSQDVPSNYLKLPNLPVGNYSWHVMTNLYVYSNTRNSAYSASWNFSTIPTPTLSSPISGSTNEPQTFTIAWHKIQTCQHAYYLYIATDTTNQNQTYYSYATYTGDTTYSVSGLLGNTVYFWWVTADNSRAFTSGLSATWKFTTAPVAQVVPSVPTLSFPSNGQINVPVVWGCDWTPSSGATSYTIQISAVQNFSTTIYNYNYPYQSGIGTHITASGLPNTTYYWRVNASNLAGTSAWSTVWNFTTISSTKVNSPSAFEIATFRARYNAGILHYALPVACTVRLKYYDLQGRLILSLVNQTLGAGYYSVTLPSNLLAPGTLLQVFQAGSFERKDKIIVTR